MEIKGGEGLGRRPTGRGLGEAGSRQGTGCVWLWRRRAGGRASPSRGRDGALRAEVPRPGGPCDVSENQATKFFNHWLQFYALTV